LYCSKNFAIFIKILLPNTDEDTILSDAIVDRIIPNSYQIMIEGKMSMRERYGIHKSKVDE
jgi:hypothetical protein